jgi:glycosyltransferase involved in cell wall biosynthesis
MNTSLFLVLPVPFRIRDGQYGLDKHACRCLIRWAEHFDRVIMAAPVLNAERAVELSKTETWQAIDSLPCADQIELVPLPYAYHPFDFIRHYRKVRALLSEKIQASDYLCFAPTIWIGDWAGVAASEAIRLGRSYSVWIDRVEYEVISRLLKDEPLKHRIKEYVTLPITKRYLQNLVRRSDLAMLQGQDCYDALAPLSSHPHCVYLIHIQKSDQIPPAQLAAKLDRLKNGAPLRIGYAGRAVEMKGGFDWIQVIQQLHQRGISLKATWLGDGHLLSAMKQMAIDLGVADLIEFGGYIGDQDQMFEIVREQDIFMFCHKTPESPRCLIEALVCGTPIVGYDSAYPRGLTATHGGGVFTPLNDQTALVNQIVALDDDRAALCKLMQKAAQSGTLYDEEVEFRYRSDLIKKYLTPGGMSTQQQAMAIR